MEKAPDAFRTISEVAEEVNVPQHVLRFWESRFAQIRPLKRGGGRRYYRPDDVDLLRGVRHLLYGEGYTIRGVQRILREEGISFVQNVWRAGAQQPPPEPQQDGAGEREGVNRDGDDRNGARAGDDPSFFGLLPLPQGLLQVLQLLAGEIFQVLAVHLFLNVIQFLGGLVQRFFGALLVLFLQVFRCFL